MELGREISIVVFKVVIVGCYMFLKLSVSPSTILYKSFVCVSALYGFQNSSTGSSYRVNVIGFFDSEILLETAL